MVIKFNKISQGMKYGEKYLIGQNSKGIKTYRQFCEDGKVITYSEKNGKPLKEIKQQLVESNLPILDENGKVVAHKTTMVTDVMNKETGVNIPIVLTETVPTNYGREYYMRNMGAKERLLDSGTADAPALRNRVVVANFDDDGNVTRATSRIYGQFKTHK